MRSARQIRFIGPTTLMLSHMAPVSRSSSSEAIAGSLSLRTTPLGRPCNVIRLRSSKSRAARSPPLLMFITDVHSLGLNVAQGLTFTETFYWDLNDQTREFSKRF